MSGIRKPYGKLTLISRALILALVNLATLPKAYAQATTIPSGSTATLSATKGVGSISTELAPPSQSLEVSGKLVVDTARSLDANSEPSWSGQYTAALGLKHKRTGISGELEVSYAREYTYQKDDGTDGDLHHASLGVSKAWESGKDFETKLVDHFALSLGSALPGSRESERRTFRGSFGPSLAVDKKIGIVTLAQAVGYKRASYEYDIRDDGTVNSPDVYKSKTDLSFELSEQWSFGIEYVYSYVVSFQGVARGADTFIYELDYQPWKSLGFGIGVLSDRATTLDPDGQTSHTSFFAQEGASGYFDMTLSF